MILNLITAPANFGYKCRPGIPLYVLTSDYSERDAAKQAGFWWNPEARRWYTVDPEKAATLLPCASPECAAQINSIVTTRVQTAQLSQATDAAIDVPAPGGLAYLPFQKVGIAFGLQHPNVLLADEMGLGKTIQAIGFINACPEIKTVLVVCPATLKSNWQRELNKWFTRKRSIAVVNGQWSDAQVVIINYDILGKWTAKIHAQPWDLLIVDESHYLKNSKAQRTANVLGKWNKDPAKKIAPILAKRRWMLTGTPIVNRPAELWTLIHALDPETWKNWKRYVETYCNAFQTRWGWDISGARNLDELQRKLRETIMVRRMKADVLTELPPKRRQIISLPAGSCDAALDAEREAEARIEERTKSLRVQAELAKADGDDTAYTEAVAAMSREWMIDFTEISRVRHETAIAKAPLVAEYCKEILDSVEKLVIFAWHADVIDLLMRQLAEFHQVSLTGQTQQDRRQGIVDTFQTDPACRVFVGNMQAAGVGITLTAASTVIFGELDWVPGNITQAEDRCHRIGQTDNVTVYHVVLENSIDEKLATTLVDKQTVIDAALNGGGQAPEEARKPVVLVPECATKSATRETIAAEATNLTSVQVEAIHNALQELSAMDTDYARTKNAMGFNKMDSEIGHSLAGRSALTPKQAALGKRIVLKYRRQLSEDIINLIKGAQNARDENHESRVD